MDYGWAALFFDLADAIDSLKKALKDLGEAGVKGAKVGGALVAELKRREIEKCGLEQDAIVARVLQNVFVYEEDKK